tara:strand:+ start:531 stop:743 length:213 start_codon:yes stop_codon:yes gene_type:complete
MRRPKHLRLIVAASLGGLLLLFALQNMAEVDLTLLFWTFRVKRILLIAVSVLIGMAIGWLLVPSRHPPRA